MDKRLKVEEDEWRESGGGRRGRRRKERERERRGNKLAEFVLKAEGADTARVVSVRVVTALHSVTHVVVLAHANSCSFHGFHAQRTSQITSTSTIQKGRLPRSTWNTDLAHVLKRLKETTQGKPPTTPIIIIIIIVSLSAQTQSISIHDTAASRICRPIFFLFAPF